jgi:APA family basic amino acid/polyamine antiporter
MSELHRSVGIPGAVLLGLGSMVGTGIFVSIFIGGGIIGPGIILAIALAALLATANALSSAQLAAAHPVSGGTYEYGYRFLSPLLGFNAGWMFLLAKSASAATAALAFAAYFRALAVPSAPEHVVPLIAVATVVLLTTVVLGGLRRTTALNAVIVAVTVGSLALLVIVAIPVWDASRLVPFLVPTPGASPGGALLHATALAFVAFTGYGRVATLGEEIRDPQRSIPRAVAVTVVVVAVLYLAVATAAAGTVGMETLAAIAADGGAPLQEMARALAPGGAGAGGIALAPSHVATASGGTRPALAVILAIGAMVATLGVLLNLILGLSRVLMAMGRRRDMPAVFATIRNGAPVAAIIAIGILVSLLTTVGSVRLTWSFSAVTVLVYYATANAAALAVPPADRRYPRWVSAGGLAGCVGLIAFIDPAVVLSAAVTIVAGLIWFRLVARRTPS